MLRIPKFKCVECLEIIYWHQNKFYLVDKKQFIHAKCLIVQISNSSVDYRNRKEG